MRDQWGDAALQAAAGRGFAVRQGLVQARGFDPEAHAEAMRLAPLLRTTPSGAAAALRDDAQGARLAAIDPDALARAHPRLAEWLVDPEHSRVAWDDLERLAKVERSLQHVRPTETLLGTLTNAWEQGATNMDIGALHVFVAYGLLDPDEAAARVAQEHERRMQQQAARRPEVVRAERRISPVLGAMDDAFSAWEETQYGDTLRPPLTNLFGSQEPPPLVNREFLTLLGSVGGVAQSVGETEAGGEFLAEQSIASLRQSAPSLVAGGIGAGAGAPFGGVGAAVGAGAGTLAGSAFVEIGAWIDQGLLGDGIDYTDPTAIAAAYRDSARMQELRAQGEAKGLTTGLVDALFAALGGGAVSRAGRGAAGGAVRRTAARAVTGAAETAVQMAGEGVSEAAGQIAATGEFSPSETVMEMLASGPTGVGEVALGVGRRRVVAALDRRRAATEAQVAVQQLGDALDESVAARRAPEAVGTLAQAAADRAGIPTTGVPIDDWNAHFRGGERSPIDVVRDLVGDEKPYHDARGTGTVEIPTAAFARLEKADRDALLPLAEITPAGSVADADAVLAELTELITAADDQVAQQEALGALEQELEGIEAELADLDSQGLADTGVVLEQPAVPDEPGVAPAEGDGEQGAAPGARGGDTPIRRLVGRLRPAVREAVATALDGAALVLSGAEAGQYDAMIAAIEQQQGIPEGALRAALPPSAAPGELSRRLRAANEAGEPTAPEPRAARRAELQARAEEIRAQLTEADAASPMAMDALADGERDRLAAELRRAGRSQAEAVIGASLYTRAMATIAQRYGMDLEGLFDRFPLSARRGEPTADGDVMAQQPLPDTIEVDGVERPTLNADGNRIHPTREGTEAFWRWFGDSKVVDERGRPRAVYHGRGTHLPVWDDWGQVSAGDQEPLEAFDRGIAYFADEPRAAEQYTGLTRWRGKPSLSAARRSDGMAPQMLAVYLRMVDPLIVQLDGEHVSTERGNALREAERGGHDGVIFEGGEDSPGHLVDPYGSLRGVFSTIYATTNAYQVKSAIGNRGTFDASDARIMSQPTPQEALPDTIEVGGVERPTLNADGNRIHPTREGTEAFWRWFGDSEVVDDRGRPLVVYKGGFLQDKAGNPLESIARPSPFPTFDPADPDGVRIAGFFAQDPRVASRFLGPANPRSSKDYDPQSPSINNAFGSVGAYYLAMRPAVFDANGDRAANIQFGPSGRGFREAIRAGADGVVIAGTSDEGTIYVATSPEQIKSAIGNRGTFDPDDARIMFQPTLAFHGTPRGRDEIEKFDTAFIGTGEGNASFGWGLYFAGKREVAEMYRAVLGGAGPVLVDGAIATGGVEKAARAVLSNGSVDAALRGLDEVQESLDIERGGLTPEAVARFDAERAAVEALRGRDVREEPGGALLTVNLAPDEDEYLLWDVPLSQQSEKVRAAMSRLPEPPDGALADFDVETMSAMLASIVDLDGDGSYVYGTLIDLYRGDEAASRALAAAGIPGIKYLDGGSRKAGAGTYNYVVFDGDLVEIVKREQRRGDEADDARIMFQPVPAFHGTPRGRDEIEKFDTAFIGTGEGAQAFGWGLYFASRRDVARSYQRALAGAPLNEDEYNWKFPDGRLSARVRGVARAAIESVQSEDASELDSTQLDQVVTAAVMEMTGIAEDLRLPDGAPEGTPERARFDAELALAVENAHARWRSREEESDLHWDDPDIAESANAAAFDYAAALTAQKMLAEGVVLAEMADGALLTVNLAPEEDEYLLWDAPLSEQSESVRAALEAMPELRGETAPVNPREMSDAALVSWLYGIDGNGEFDYDPDTWDTQVEWRLDLEDIADSFLAEMEEDERRHPFMENDPDGRAIYNTLVMHLGGGDNYGRGGNDQRVASLALHAAGIPGIKYLDGGSRNRPLRQIRDAVMAELPEDADFESVGELIDAGTLAPERAEFLDALREDDWLGFDYPSQAISAALRDLSQFDVSDRLRQSIAALRADGTYNYVVFDGDLVEIVKREQRRGDEARAAIRMARTGRSRAFDVEFYKGADPSSFYHELGHYFLEVLGDIAEDADAPAALRDEFASVLKRLGVESRDGIGTEQHETWARSFEAYLMEGRAPSRELRAMFATFRAWLVRVYRTLRGLDVELTAELRQVFDRLLATDEEIREARDDENARALFGSAEEAGMTPDEWRDYQDALQVALDEATQALDEKLLRAVTREARKAHRERLAEIREDVARRVDARPGAIARSWLADGTRPDGSPLPDGLEPSKLDAEEIARRYEGPVQGALKRMGVVGPADEPGIPLDVAARIVGLERPEQLVEALLEVTSKPKLIEAEARAQLAAEHPDLVMFAGRRRAAARGAVLDARNQVLRREHDALRKRARDAEIDVAAERASRGIEEDARRSAMADLPGQAIVRERTRAALENVPLGELQPTRRRLASRREARRAADRVAVGAFDQAAESVRRQLLNLDLGAVGQQLLEESQKHLRAIRRAIKPRALATIGRTDPMRRDAIRDIAATLGLDQGADPPKARVERLRAMAAQLELEGRVLPLVSSPGNGGIPDWIFGEPHAVRDLTARQIEEAGQVVQALQHHARRDRELLREREGIEFDQRIGEAVQSITASRPERKHARRLGSLPPGLAAVEEFARDATSLRKLSSLVREMDQEQDIGPVYAVLLRALNDAAPDESLRVADLAPRFEELMSTFTPQERLDMASREIAIPGLYDDRGQPMSLTMEVILSVALNWGNAGNRQRVTGMSDVPSRGHFSRAQVEALILPRLTERHWDFVEAAWALVGSFRDEIVEHHQRIHGLQLKTVPAEPFTVRPADSDRTREVSGGYYPIKFDDIRSTRQDAAQAYDEARRGAAVASVTKHGHTNERVAQTDRPLRFELSIIPRHLFEVVHDLTHREAIMDVSRVLRDKRIAQAIRDHYGDGVRTQIEKLVQDVAANGRKELGPFESIARHMRYATTISVLGFRVTTALLQFTGLIPAMTRTGVTPLLRAVSYLFFEGRTSERFARMADASPLIATRDTTHDRDVRELMENTRFATSMLDYYKELAARRVTGGRAGFSEMAAWAMWMTANAQKSVDRIVWQAAALKAADEGVVDEVAIREIADQAVIDTQGSGFIKDLSGAQRSNEFFRWLTLFYSWGNTQLNLNANALRARMAGRSSNGRFLSDVLLINVIPTAIATMALSALDPRDDDEDLREQLIRDQAAAFVAMFPGLREFGGPVQGYERYEGPAGMRPLVSLIALYNQLEQFEADEGLGYAAKEVLTTTFGIPTSQFEKTIDGAHALLSGETSNPGALIMGGPR